MAGTITIDKAGRVVIPKELRDALGLTGGARLGVRLEGGRVVLEPLDTRSGIEEVDGLLVATGELEGEPTDHRELRSAG